MDRTAVDPFAGIERIAKLSAKEKEELLNEAKAGLEVIEKETPLIVALGDLLTASTSALIVYILLLSVLGNMLQDLL